VGDKVSSPFGLEKKKVQGEKSRKLTDFLLLGLVVYDAYLVE